MDTKELVDALTVKLGENKQTFLSELRAELKSYIQGQGKNCLTIVEHKSWGKKSWELSASPDYVKRLIAFCREKDFDGNKLDSGLTEPIIERIADKFSGLYAQQEQHLAELLAHRVMTDKTMSAALVDGIVGTAAHSLTEGAKQKLAALLLEPIKQSAAQIVQSSAGQAAAHTVISAVKSSAAHMSAPIAAKIAILLAQSLSTTLKVVLAKVLASAALKAAIAAAVKKFLVAAIVAAIVKLVAAKFGITALGAFVWVLIPLIAAYITYEVIVFPETLGEKVSEKVVSDLAGSFDQINRSAMETVVSEVFANGVGGLGAQIGKSEAMQQLIAELIKSAAA